MAMNITIEAKGFLDAIQKAPNAIMRAIERGVKEGFVEIQREARVQHRFRRKSGNLQRSIQVDFKSFKDQGTGIRLETGIAPYGPAIHEGSVPHRIYAKNKKALAFIMNGRKVMVPKNPHKMPGYLGGNDMADNTVWSQKGYVDHPGTAPDPFLFNAAKRQGPTMQTLINISVADAIKKLGFGV